MLCLFQKYNNNNKIIKSSRGLQDIKNNKRQHADL